MPASQQPTPAIDLKPQEVNAYDLAALYLTNAGLPNTAKNRVTLAAWFLAESAHGHTPGTIIMYNNNPLNWTGSGDAGSHKFAGNHLFFASYSTPQAGAQGWWDFLNRNGYTGVITALRTQDQKSFPYVVGRSGWGTSAQGIFNSLQAHPTDLSTGAALEIRTIYGQQFAIGKTFTQQDADRLYSAILASGQTSSDPTGTANQIIKAVINKYVGQPISDQLFGNMGKDVQAQAPLVAAALNPLSHGNVLGGVGDAVGGAAGALSGVDKIANWLTGPSTPTRWVHIGAVLLGTIMVGAGVWVMIKGVNRPGLNAGGGGGNLVINENFGDDEVDSLEDEVAPPPPRRKSRAQPIDWEKEKAEARAQEERMRKANEQNSGSTFQGAAPAS